MDTEPDWWPGDSIAPFSLMEVGNIHVVHPVRIEVSEANNRCWLFWLYDFTIIWRNRRVFHTNCHLKCLHHARLSTRLIKKVKKFWLNFLEDGVQIIMDLILIKKSGSQSGFMNFFFFYIEEQMNEWSPLNKSKNNCCEQTFLWSMHICNFTQSTQ